MLDSMGPTSGNHGADVGLISFGARGNIFLIYLPMPSVHGVFFHAESGKGLGDNLVPMGPYLLMGPTGRTT